MPTARVGTRRDGVAHAFGLPAPYPPMDYWPQKHHVASWPGSGFKLAASMPAIAQASSRSEVSPETPTAPIMSPTAVLISTPPGLVMLRAFSGKLDTGFPQKMRSTKEAGARFRFNLIETPSSAARPVGRHCGDFRRARDVPFGFPLSCPLSPSGAARQCRSESIHLEAGRLHDGCPLLQLAGDQCREILRGSALRLETGLPHVRLHSEDFRLSLTSLLSLTTMSAGKPAGPRIP